MKMGAVPIRAALLALIALLAIIWTLRAAAVVTIPIAAALLAALTVAPISSLVQRRMPETLRSLGPISATAIVLTAVLALVAGRSIAASQIADVLPSAIARARAAVESGGIRLLGFEMVDPAQVRGLAAQLMEPTVLIARAVLATLAGATTCIVLMMFLVLLILLESHAWRRKSKWSPAAALVCWRWGRPKSTFAGFLWPGCSARC